MIVVDTNILAYLYLPSDFNAKVEALLCKDSCWISPLLWRSEFRNILALYMRKKILSLSDALEIQHEAESMLAGNEYQVDSLNVLSLAKQSGCSAYDCEFISLAEHANTKLITEDKKLLRAFPMLAVTVDEFVGPQL
jgi:predicted nucleic acid-binding protein